MTADVTLLTPPYNFAVVQLPERKYPGVVFQGDTLHSMTTQISEMQKLLEEHDLTNLSEEIRLLLDDLLKIQKSYERACSDQGIELPYFR